MVEVWSRSRCAEVHVTVEPRLTEPCSLIEPRPAELRATEERHEEVRALEKPRSFEASEPPELRPGERCVLTEPRLPYSRTVFKRAQGREAAARTAVEVGTVGLGLAIGGPVGALVAATIKPTLELIALRERRGLDNIERVVESVTESTGLSPDELAAWASSTDGRLMLTTNVIQTAYNTLYEAKVAALVTVLVANLRDEAQLDISAVIVGTLADLEATHVRVLHAIDREDLPRRVDDLEHVPGVALQSQLEAYFPNLALGILPIMATLERHKLVKEAIAHADDDYAWRVTSFGRRCLTYLVDRPSS